MELFKLFGTIAVNNEEANNAIDETMNAAEQGENKMSSAFKKIGAAVATYFAAEKIIAFGKEAVNVAAEVSAEASAFEQIMGDYSEQASEKINKIADATGMVSTRLTPYMTSMTAKFKGLGYDIDDATDLASDGLNLAADAAAFWDKSLDDSMSALNSFINGSYEGGEAIGLFANDTQLASYAVKNGIVSETKAWANLDEARKQATRLEYAQAMMKASGATGQAAKEANQYANVQANLNEKWRQFKAQIGEPLLQNVVLPAMEKLSSLVDVASVAFKKLSGFVSEHKGLLAALAVIIGIITTALTIQSAVQAVQTAMNAAEVTSLGALIAAKLASAAATMAALAPYLLIAAAIAAVIAIIVICVKHWDEIKAKVIEVAEKIKAKITEMKEKVVAKFQEIKDGIHSKVEAIKTSVSTKFEEIKEKIMNPVNKARDAVKAAVDKIKGFFDNLKLKLPNIKLPHFSLKGSFSLSPPSVPKLSVDWYAKAMNNAMLLNSPTIFGVNSIGQLMGGGEAGQEVVAGSATLMSMIRGAVKEETGGISVMFERLISMLAEYFPEILEKMTRDFVFDDGVVAARLAPAIDSRLGDINRLRERGK